MRNLFIKLLCIALTLSLALTVFIVPSVSASGEHSIVVRYDKNLGDVEVSVNSVAAAAAGIDYAMIWKANKALTANTAVKIMDGITITAAENFEYDRGRKATINSVDFAGAVRGSNNASVSESGATGAAFKVDSQKTGTLYFAMTVASGKGVKAVNVNDIKTPLVDYKNETGGNVDDISIWGLDVKAGESYYFYPTGTKPWIYGAFFEEKTVVSAAAGNTVTIKATPKGGNYIGNVWLGDDAVPVTKNEGMTECSFVMPDSDAEVNVDFISSAVNDEIRQLSFDKIKGSNNSENEVYDDLAPISGFDSSFIGYADVSWESSNEDVISISGEVNGKSVDTQVEFTGVFTWQAYPNLRLTKTFHITVPADNDDTAAVAAAKEALTLGDTSSVKKNLDLPTIGRRSTTITWSSSNPAVVGADGAVSPIWEQSATVTLTATISRGSATPLTKDFTIIVPAQYALTVNRIAVSNADGDVVMTPADGGYISHIVITDNIINKKDEALIAAVYSSDGSKLLSCGVVKLNALTAEQYSENNGEKIIYLDKLAIDKIPVYNDCKIKVFAFDSLANQKPATSQPAYVYNTDIKDSPTIFVAGDSTASYYEPKGGGNNFPRTGWAQVLQDYFSEVTVKDLAYSGRSSRSFRKESNYKTIKNGLKAGDYFIIQFGHNDEKSGDTYTDPAGDRFTSGSYKNSLTEYYVNIALDKGAYPILATSISRRRTSDSGLEAYVNATKQLGYELGLPVVDLYAKTNGYINAVGAEQAKDIFNHVKVKDSRFGGLSAGDFKNSQYYTKGAADNTHINYFGAQMISQWFCDELERLGHPLLSKRSSHTTKLENIPSYADAVSE